MTGTSWIIAPELGFPTSLCLWLTVNGWTWPMRLQDGIVPPLPFPATPDLFLPRIVPLPSVKDADA